jgi:drug/metabolite transporter (DMT)-like permease
MTIASAPVRHGNGAAIAAIAVTVVLWASAFPGIRAGLAAFSPTELAALRFIVASAALAVYAVATRMRLPDRRDWGRIALAGLVGIAGYNIALNLGEVTVSAGAASFIVNTVPVFTALLAVALLGERLTKWGRLGLGVSFAGVGVIALGEVGGLSFGAGALLVLLAAICQALYFVLQKPLLARHGALPLTTAVVWAGTAALLPWVPAALAAVPAAPTPALAAAVYLGLFPGAVAYVAWSYALARYPAARAASFLYLVPPVATAIAVPWLGELPSSLGLVGGAMTLAGVILVNSKGKQRKDPGRPG